MLSSSLSSGLSAIGLIILEDFVRPFRPNLSDLNATRCTKLITVIFAAMIAGAVFIVASVKTLSDVSLLYKNTHEIVIANNVATRLL